MSENEQISINYFFMFLFYFLRKKIIQSLEIMKRNLLI